MNTWQGHGTWEELKRDAVVDKLREHATNFRESHPWPTIHKTPVREKEDGRFVKAFALEFPSGTGDLENGPKKKQSALKKTNCFFKSKSLSNRD